MGARFKLALVGTLRKRHMDNRAKRYDKILGG